MFKVEDCLPPYCYATDMEGKCIMLKLGQKGYYPCRVHNASADVLNTQLGVTPAQVEAMSVGTMMGWVPGINPEVFKKREG